MLFYFSKVFIDWGLQKKQAKKVQDILWPIVICRSLATRSYIQTPSVTIFLRSSQARFNVLLGCFFVLANSPGGDKDLMPPLFPLEGCYGF